MPAFSGVDYLDFDSLLNDEEKLARQTARQFVDEQFLPIIEKHNREGKVPHATASRKSASSGFFGANLEGYGCAGMSNVAYGLVTQELERGDSGLRSFVSVQSALVMYPIYAFGSDAQKEKWLPLLAAGKAIGCFGLTEPQFGSNPGGMLTRAVRKGDKLHPERRKNVDHQRLASPTSPSSGRNAKTTKSAASWSKKARRDSKPGTCTANGRCALRSLRAWR